VTKALFVSTHFPKDWSKSTTGAYKRMRMFVDALRVRATVKFLFYYRPELDSDTARFEKTRQDIINEWQLAVEDVVLCKQAPEPSYTTDIWSAYFSPILGMRRQIGYARTTGRAQLDALNKCLEGEPDLLFAHRLNCAWPMILLKRALPPIFLDLDDIEHKAFLRELAQPPQWIMKRLCYLQWPALLLGERQAIKISRKAFVCSDLDARYLRRNWRLANVKAIANAVRVPESASRSDECSVLFLGMYAYDPNAVAAEILVTRIWPLIRAACPRAKLIIAGSGPERLRCFEKHHEGIEYTGFVHDLDALYGRTRVVCCPIQSGGGTRVKIVEAASYGKPVVSTKIGAEGLDFVDGHDIVIRNDAAALADACIGLLRSEAMCARIGNAARVRVKKQYERDSVIQLIQHEIFGDARFGGAAQPSAG
jgi:glycosyltransferase involved in cell wall biosynthesis